MTEKMELKYGWGFYVNVYKGVSEIRHGQFSLHWGSRGYSHVLWSESNTCQLEKNLQNNYGQSLRDIVSLLFYSYFCSR